MMHNKFIFIETDALTTNNKLATNLIPSLLDLQEAGFHLVLICENSLPITQTVELLESQGARFEETVSPTASTTRRYLCELNLARDQSYVVGNGQCALLMAEQLGLSIFRTIDWKTLTHDILTHPRKAHVIRKTKETKIEIEIALDSPGNIEVSTGIGYFDHMLEQLAKHGGFEMSVQVEGDLHIDEHHTVEDTAIALGECLRKALGDKMGIGRYGFVLPMDEAEARVSIDLSGRAFLLFDGDFKRESVGGLPTELVSHFFRSFAGTLAATIHIEVFGENAHHMIESCFKGVGRALRPALGRGIQIEIPSTKGVL
jgi:imidazoleglycerol-phosphate dehydratase / histidinol-phosphatase